MGHIIIILFIPQFKTLNFLLQLLSEINIPILCHQPQHFCFLFYHES